MAPGLNSRQTGTVPRNRPRNGASQSHRGIREPLVQSNSFEWEPVLDQNSRPRSHRKLSSTHSETEADLIRYDIAGSLPSAMSSQLRLEDNVNEGQDISRIRHLPDKKQVINKITQIQDYIQQTASLMNALKTTDCPEKRKQYDQLSAILLGLQDSEGKLKETLKNMDSSEADNDSLPAVNANQGERTCNSNSESNEEELILRTEESKRKLELLQKRKQELLELQEKARKQLQEAQMEQSRLVARASTLNQDINSNRFLDVNVQQLNQRIRNAQQLFKTTNQINASLEDGKNSNVDDAEHADEDQTEISDTETDYQIVSDKVAEFNMMKTQLAQIQKIMANISLDQSAKEGTPLTFDTNDERREQGAQLQQQKPIRNEETADENSSNALKLEQAKLKLNQLTQLLEIAQSVQGSKILTPNYPQISSNPTHCEGDNLRQSPSPGCSAKSHQRPSDEAYVETMQLMTRELEERTAAVKEEHERLLAARQEIENIARKIPLVKTERISLSPDDSGSEAPCLTNISVESSGRLVGSSAPKEQQLCSERSPPYTCRTGHSKTKRGAWSAFAPSMNFSAQEKKCKNEELSRSLQHLASIQCSPQEQQIWSPSPTVSFCDNTSCSGVQPQNHVEKSANPYGRMINEVVPRPIRSEDITIDELYSQYQYLTRTVAQCSHLLWLQQKQIIELRNSLMLQQSAMFQNVLPQPMLFNQPQRHANLPHQSYQFNPVPTMPYPTLNNPPQMHTQQDPNFMSPNQSLKLNSSAISNVQTSQDFSDQFYQHGAVAGLPISVLDVPDYQFRCGNYNRSTSQNTNSNSNVNQNFNQNSASCLNNRVPVGGVSYLGPEDSGALNNQVPPGNRANNYWDNFRSYSRQNLLSHSKSNEDTDANRRASTSSNQERPMRETASSIMIQNNTPPGSSNEAPEASQVHGPVDPSTYDEYQFPSQQSSTTRPVRAHVTRSRSVETQSHRNPVKNETRNQEIDPRNLNPKNETIITGVRSRNPEGGSENIRNVRNDVAQTGRNSDCASGGSNRNFIQLVRDFENEESSHGNNKKRLDKGGNRNDGCGNLNNRMNHGLPIQVRDNVYAEVTNFIRTNENHPQFLIQLFRDLQQVTTDPLRQRTLESIQETVNANNLAERSNINGANLNIIDNRNNIRENRSNLNRNQTEEPNILEDIVSQIRENQNTFRQNIGGSSASSTAGNLENPNISNLRNLGSHRNNLESDGLRDLRTYFEANLCNFGHNSALENPNLSNIRENLTRRGTAANDLDNANPKNLYLSMYDNMGRRNQELISGTDLTPSPQNSRNSDQMGSDHEVNDFRGSMEGARSNSQFIPIVSVGPRLEMRGDGNFSESRQTPPRGPVLDRDNNENITRDLEGNVKDFDLDNRSDTKKFRRNSGSCNDARNIKTEDVEENNMEEKGATAVFSSDWERNSPENRSLTMPGGFQTDNVTGSGAYECFGCTCEVVEELDNGDLAEADQSHNEEASGAESNNCLGNAQGPETESDITNEEEADGAESNNCLGNAQGPETQCNFTYDEVAAGFVSNNCLLIAQGPETACGITSDENQSSQYPETMIHNSKRKSLAPETNFSDARETESDVEFYWENSSEYDEHISVCCEDDP